MDSGELNSVVDPPNNISVSYQPDKGKQPITVEEEKTEYSESSTSELLGVICRSEEEAYDLYNSYAFRKCFGTRKESQKYYPDGTVQKKIFCCSCAGKKDLKKLDSRTYSRSDFRTGCKAKILFKVDKLGNWEATAHDMIHNHPFCDESQVHLLRSHRKVNEDQLQFLTQMKESGVSVAKTIRFLAAESGGTSQVGFVKKDVYNALSVARKEYFDGTDSQSLVQIFKRREQIEEDFYYDFSIDVDGRLCRFFWRDGRMKNDYLLFGDLVVHDTTYRTNKYNMICAPFVGMNNHCQNVMFGCGCLLNEQLESFNWLFETFLKSMDGVFPQTIMTDQCAFMASAIDKVFPTSQHRLCIWHLMENSKKHLPHLYHKKKGFSEQFQNILKYCETEAEFNHLWGRFVKQYDCEDNVWLRKLHGIRQKWCRAYSKNYFSGGALSSQISESTNHSISRDLHKTADLCQFYNTFCRVVFEWRDRENEEDLKSSTGKPDMIVPVVKLLIDAQEVYTIQAYKLFEREYMKSLALSQEVYSTQEDGTIIYHVWQQDLEIIKHAVKFKRQDSGVLCTCKLLTEVGILCSHSIRILDINCVNRLADRYVLRRWRKDLSLLKKQYHQSSSFMRDGHESLSQTAWTMMMGRRFQSLVIASASNKEARNFCENVWKDLKQKIDSEVGETHLLEISANHQQPTNIVQNPQGSKPKGKKSQRLKRTIEKKRKAKKGRSQNSIREFLQKKDCVQAMMNVDEDVQASGISFVHPIDDGGTLSRIFPDLDGNNNVA